MMPIRYPNWDKVSLEKVRDYTSYERYIEQLSNSKVIGEVKYSELIYKIYEIEINNNAEHDVLIFGGVHGDEPSGVQSSADFAENYDSFNFSKLYNYKIVPIVNPWGFEHNVRYNAKGIDINRDFADLNFESQEAEIIIKEYGKLNPIIVIDNHESNYNNDNFFFVYNNESASKLKTFVDQNRQYKYTTDLKAFPAKTIDGINEIDSGLLGITQLSDRWTLSNYFLKKTLNVVVIESGTVGVEFNVRNKFHLDSMSYIIENF